MFLGLLAGDLKHREDILFHSWQISLSHVHLNSNSCETQLQEIKLRLHAKGKGDQFDPTSASVFAKP
jgi:hypothetical protein